MAGQYTFWGEVQRAWLRFWRLPWKWKGPVLGVVAVLIIIGVAASGGGSGDSKGTRGAQPATEVAAVESAEKATNTPKPSNTPKPTNTAKPSPTATNTPAPPEFIRGLTAVDVTGNLKDRGFDCKGPTKLQTLVEWVCENSADDIKVSMLGRDATHIRSIDATVFAFSAAPSDARAKDFLGFLATVPYDDASQAEARAWVEAHIGEQTEMVFGSAKYSVYGPPAARTLEIVAAGAR